jgi:hypothetical protein
MWVVATVLMLVAAGAKTLLGGFEPWLASTGIFPVWSVSVVTRGTVALEALTGVLLIWPQCRRQGWVIAGGLGAAFATIHAAGILLGNVRPCRCLGIELSRDAAQYGAMV